MPIKNSECFDPVDYYINELAPKLEDNAKNFFDKLVKDNKIDVNANNHTSEQINIYQKKSNDCTKSIKNFSILNIFIIILIVVFIFFIIFGAFKIFNNETNNTYIIFLVLGILGLIASIIGLYFLTKKIKKLKKEGCGLKDKLNELYKEADIQLSALKTSFKFNDFNNIFRKSTSIFDIDDYLKPEKLLLLKNVYDYVDDFTDKESIVSCLSGEVNTNPFLRVRVYHQDMRDKVYTGTKVVTYIVDDTDSKGNLVTRTVTETLVANITKPAPYYDYATFTIYGNMAAPNLTFSRHPVVPFNASEKEINRIVKKGEKTLNRLTDQAIKSGKSFTSLANTEFETLFGAYNRTNETEYRLLFTPLAQQNTLEIIKGKAGYGDDFSFYKKGKINIINSSHGPSIPDYSEGSYSYFYSSNMMKDAFVNDICNIAKSMYFELSPILAIPLYQLTEAGSFDPKKELLPNVDKYETETIANKMNKSLFMPEDAKTPQILKVKFKKKVNKNDIYNVASHAFTIEILCEMVPVMAGNGQVYLVPVYYDNYIPVSRNTEIIVREFDRTKLSNLLKDDIDSSLVGPTINKNFLSFFYNGTQNQDVDKILEQLEEKIDKI